MDQRIKAAVHRRIADGGALHMQTEVLGAETEIFNLNQRGDDQYVNKRAIKNDIEKAHFRRSQFDTCPHQRKEPAGDDHPQSNHDFLGVPPQWATKIKRGESIRPYGNSIAV
ncbi:hypothetical protein D3C80_1332150 [compost metagenome]